MSDANLDDFDRKFLSKGEAFADHVCELTKEGERDRRSKQDAMRQEIRERHPEGWLDLDAIVFSMQQNGLMMLKRADEVEDAHSEMRDALCLLQCSATLVLQEISTLLLDGFWAGAVGRWRALHELAVTSILLGKYGPRLAERYLDHGFVVQTRRLSDYFTTHKVGPVGPEELAQRRERAVDLTAKHTLPDEGRPFRDPYGWASVLMPLDRRGEKRVSPSFDRLEKLADLAHLRLLVASAHGLVHGDSAGVVTGVRLGDNAWALGPVPIFTETVARPTFLTIERIVAGTHGAFEPEINDFADTLAVVGSGVLALCKRGLSAFEGERVDPHRN